MEDWQQLLVEVDSRDCGNTKRWTELAEHWNNMAGTVFTTAVSTISGGLVTVFCFGFVKGGM